MFFFTEEKSSRNSFRKGAVLIIKEIFIGTLVLFNTGSPLWILGDMVTWCNIFMIFKDRKTCFFNTRCRLLMWYAINESPLIVLLSKNITRRVNTLDNQHKETLVKKFVSSSHNLITLFFLKNILTIFKIKNKVRLIRLLS